MTAKAWRCTSHSLTVVFEVWASPTNVQTCMQTAIEFARTIPRQKRYFRLFWICTFFLWNTHQFCEPPGLLLSLVQTIFAIFLRNRRSWLGRTKWHRSFWQVWLASFHSLKNVHTNTQQVWLQFIDKRTPCFLGFFFPQSRPTRH